MQGLNTGIITTPSQWPVRGAGGRWRGKLAAPALCELQHPRKRRGILSVNAPDNYPESLHRSTHRSSRAPALHFCATLGAMAANLQSKGLSVHPMRARIVQAHLSGQSAREIASWLRPPAAHTTVQRFIALHVIPILQNAEALKALISFNREENIGLPVALQNAPTALHIDKLAHQALGSNLQSVDVGPILTSRDGRIAAQQDRHRRLSQVIAERAKDMDGCQRCNHLESEHPYQGVRPDGKLVDCAEYQGIPGGRTGLMVGKLKKEGIEYGVDVGLLSELREHEKHIAIEMGQWQENNGTGSVSVQIICPQAPDGQLPRVSFASGDAIEAGEDIGLLQRPV